MSGIKVSQICYDGDLTPASLRELILQHKKHVVVTQINETLVKNQVKKEPKHLQKKIGSKPEGKRAFSKLKKNSNPYKSFPIGYNLKHN